MKLLNAGNAKTKKGEKLGFITYGIHLAPHKQSGFNVCGSASAGCIKACLNTAGRGAMANVQTARENKTRFFFEDRTAFFDQLKKEITAAIKSAAKKDMQPVFRLNLTSDLPFESIKCPTEKKTIFELFPQVKFYDYTKHFKRMLAFLKNEMPENYHLTFSRSESNDSLVQIVLDLGGNVAAVFRGSLPKTWKGKPVVDGDETDLRFLDPKNIIVGLVEKGLAKKDKSGFVIG